MGSRAGQGRVPRLPGFILLVGFSGALLVFLVWSWSGIAICRCLVGWLSTVRVLWFLRAMGLFLPGDGTFWAVGGLLGYV